MNNKEIGMALSQILDKLDKIGAAVAQTAPKTAKNSAEAVLRERLDRLTIKRHAVLTASLGGVSYQEMAKIMMCDITTVKLHLKAALNLLEIPTRSILLASHKQMLECIPDKEYIQRYGISKRWWLEHNQELMDVLTATKPPANQFTEKKT